MILKSRAKPQVSPGGGEFAMANRSSDPLEVSRPQVALGNEEDPPRMGPDLLRIEPCFEDVALELGANTPNGQGPIRAGTASQGLQPREDVLLLLGEGSQVPLQDLRHLFREHAADLRTTLPYDRQVNMPAMSPDAPSLKPHHLRYPEALIEHEEDHQ